MRATVMNEARDVRVEDVPNRLERGGAGGGQEVTDGERASLRKTRRALEG
jgi:hypothetical protein